MPISVAGPRRPRGAAAPLRALVRDTLAGEGRRAGEITVVLESDGTLRSLNRRWRGLDRATDVLSFGHDGSGPAAGAPRDPAAVSGDLVISMDRVREQAKRFRVGPGRELARLAIHGALHLAGHDHHRPAERRAMRAREERALRAGREAVAALERALAATMRGARRAAGARGGRG